MSSPTRRLSGLGSPRPNPEVLARGQPPAQGPSPGGGMGAARRNPPKAPSPGSGLGEPVKQTGSMTLMVTGAEFLPNGRVRVSMESDTAPSPLGTCWAFYAALVGYPGQRLIDTYLQPITYGTCYSRWEFNGSLPQGTQEAEVWVWWANDLRGWFEAPPAFEQAVGTDDLMSPPPALKSDRFPLVKTEEGRERGVYEEETDPVLESAGDFGTGVGETIQDTVTSLALLGGAAALVYYGGPLLTATAERAASAVEPSEEDSGASGSSGGGSSGSASDARSEDPDSEDPDEVKVVTPEGMSKEEVPAPPISRGKLPS